jgi:outer membrane biosynthesis protein TonB
MSAPQMKERPASVLRAMFAGFGSLMSVMDKMRSKPAAEAPADAAATAPQTPEAPAATATETTAEPDTVAAESTAETDAKTEPDTAAAVAEPAPAAEPVAADTAAEPVAAAETATESATTTEAEAAVEPGPVAALPLANYDELTVASLRARLRNLSNDDINQLVTYEQAHQDRPEVIKMFKNRLIKMTSGFQKLES